MSRIIDRRIMTVNDQKFYRTISLFNGAFGEMYTIKYYKPFRYSFEYYETADIEQVVENSEKRLVENLNKIDKANKYLKGE